VESTLNKDGHAAGAEWVAGARAKGEFRCGGCSYGVTVYRSLPVCPMCHGTEWERVPWCPYTRVVSHLDD
jgi:Zn finger protein HypA/HybF involved in hydrogenase expression